MTNKRTLVKKTQKHTDKETKAKATGPSSPASTAQIIIAGYKCGIQYSTGLLAQCRSASP